MLNISVTDGNPSSPTYGQSVAPHYSYVYDEAGNELLQVTPDEQAAYQAWVGAGHDPAAFTGGTRI